MFDPVVLNPVAIIHSVRQAVEDDFWGKVVSVIEFDNKRFTPDSLKGLEAFSHLEVVFYMHEVKDSKVEMGARHPRNDENLPKVGVFSQRGKNRPNKIGVSRCRILSIDDLRITVEALDAIDKTPVLDVKPYMQSFGPIGEVREPEWVQEIMRNYFLTQGAASSSTGQSTQTKQSSQVKN